MLRPRVFPALLSCLWLVVSHGLFVIIMAYADPGSLILLGLLFAYVVVVTGIALAGTVMNLLRPPLEFRLEGLLVRPPFTPPRLMAWESIEWSVIRRRERDGCDEWLFQVDEPWTARWTHPLESLDATAWNGRPSARLFRLSLENWDQPPDLIARALESALAAARTRGPDPTLLPHLAAFGFPREDAV